jgi:L-fucose mutarotase/ribose pyranase (RbsD/FucU family)
MLEKFNCSQLREGITALTMLLNLQTFVANHVTCHNKVQMKETQQTVHQVVKIYIKTYTYKQANLLKSTYYGECAFEYTVTTKTLLDFK